MEILLHLVEGVPSSLPWAIAGALNADACEIYSDVDGVYTTTEELNQRAKEDGF